MKKLQIDLDQAILQLESLGYTDSDSIFLRKIPAKGVSGVAKKSTVAYRSLPTTQLPDGGLYFVVNGGGHVDKAVGKGRALFCEWDDLPIEEQITLWQSKGFPAPSFQVQTRKSVHCYWVLDEPMAIAQWKELQTQFLEFMDADRTLKNPSRVMRLAGGWHIAEGKDPIKCEMINFTGEKFAVDDLKGLIRFHQAATPLPAAPIKQREVSGDIIPLDHFLTKSDRQLLEQGAPKGQRNQSAFRIACNLRSRDTALYEMGIDHGGYAYQTFIDFCNRCTSSPDWNQKEWSTIWRQSEGKGTAPDKSKMQEIYDYWRSPKKPKSGDRQISKQKFEKVLALVKGSDPETAEIIAKTTTAIAPLKTYEESRTETSEQGETEQIEPDLTYQEIARKEIYGKGHYVVLSGEFYAFNGTHYEQRHQSEEIRKIRAWAGSYRIYNKRTGRWQYSLLNTKSINEIWKWILLVYEQKPDVINPPGVNLANGTLRITWDGNTPSWKLHPHTHKDIYVYCSPVAYDPSANPENCDRLLECLDPTPRTALLRHLSASFDLEKVRTFASRQIRAGIAKGTGSNGKDSIRAAIAKIFGAQMTCIDLGDFLLYDQGKRFYLKDFAFARVNWSSENNQETSLDKSQILNICITGEDNALLIEDKNVKAYRTTCKAIQIFNCNQLPKLKSGMDSLATRFVIYDFNKTFKSNPNLQRGELPADPRFHDDPEFLIKEVCPALLNKLLIELGNLAKFGIDYGEMDKGLERLKEQSSHLWQFVNDQGIESDADGQIWTKDLWEKLKDWYLDQGTLEVTNLDNGKTKNIWYDQANKYDTNVTGANQIHKRMKQLFPKIENLRETKNPEKRGCFYLSGISFKANNPAPLLHNPDSTNVSASLSASPCFTTDVSASSTTIPPYSPCEAKNEASKEAKTLTEQSSEAAKQKTNISEENTHQSFQLGDLALYLKTREVVSIIALPTYSTDGKNTLHRCRFVEDVLTEQFIPIHELKPWLG